MCGCRCRLRGRETRDQVHVRRAHLPGGAQHAAVAAAAVVPFSPTEMSTFCSTWLIRPHSRGRQPVFCSLHCRAKYAHMRDSLRDELERLEGISALRRQGNQHRPHVPDRSYSMATQQISVVRQALQRAHEPDIRSPKWRRRRGLHGITGRSRPALPIASATWMRHALRATPA